MIERTAATPVPPQANERPYWILWAHLPISAGPSWRVRNHFGSLKQAWLADSLELASAGVNAEARAALPKLRDQLVPDVVAEHLRASGISTCAFGEPDYPPLLKTIHDPPLVLFYRGQLSASGPALAVVGTRRSSDYGEQVTWDITRTLAERGMTIVSGLALGIDTAAHRAALAANGRTVAVLGSGVDQKTVYPPSNRRLAEEICKRGAVISEYPPGAQPLPYRFPQRNRIIAGMSAGTLVIEAPELSGALITARAAAEENREVLAVPGRITDKNAAGPLKLIASGAHVVCSADDVCAALGLELIPSQGTQTHTPSDPQTAVLAGLTQPQNRDQLQRETKLAPPQLNCALTMLEINGAIRRLPSGKFVRTSGS